MAKPKRKTMTQDEWRAEMVTSANKRAFLEGLEGVADVEIPDDLYWLLSCLDTSEISDLADWVEKVVKKAKRTK